MPYYEFECQGCFNVFEFFHHIHESPEIKCSKCGSKDIKKLITQINILGSRDNFGIKNAFRDDNSGKTIDNWRSWEKAGYRDPLDVTKNHDVKEKIKRKIEKIKKYDSNSTVYIKT